MKRPFLYQSTPVTRLLFSLFVILSVFLVVYLLSFGIGFLIWGTDFIENISNTDLPSETTIIQLKYLQTAFSIGAFILPTFIISYFITNSTTEYLMFRKVSNWQVFFLSGILIIALVPFVNFLAYWNSSIKLPSSLEHLEQIIKSAEANAIELTSMFLDVDTIWGLICNVIIMAVIPAIGEELLFRGVLQRIITEWTKNVFLGVVISAFLFSLLHFQFYGFFPRFLLGVVMGFLLVWTKNIWIPIFAHFLNNAFAVILNFVYRDTSGIDEVENFGAQDETRIFLMVSIFMTVFLIYYIRKIVNGKYDYLKTVLMKLDS